MMFQWIADNIWTIVIGAALIGIVAAVIAGMVRKKLRGGSVICSCGSCEGCAMRGSCHKKSADRSEGSE